MRQLLKTLKDGLYSVINRLVYRNWLVSRICGKTLRKYITCEEFKERRVDYFVYDERFPEKDMLELAETEGLRPDADILAYTEIESDDVIFIAFSLEVIFMYIEFENPIFAYRLIQEVAKHEAYHAKQYNYLLQGGRDAINRLFDYLKDTDYKDNFLEKGAFDFQFEDIEQDFSIFDRFIYPERFADKKNMPVK